MVGLLAGVVLLVGIGRQRRQTGLRTQNNGETMEQISPPAAEAFQISPSLQRANSVEEKLSSEGWYKLYLSASWDKVDCREQVEGFLSTGLNRGLFLVGSVGVGKTSVMTLIAKEIVERTDIIPRFVALGMLFDLYFERDFKAVERFMKSAYLLIDDIGREYAADFPVAKFENFIEYRYGNLLPTFITSNLTIDDLRKRIGFERIADRINDPKWMAHLIYAGQSKRIRV